MKLTSLVCSAVLASSINARLVCDPATTILTSTVVPSDFLFLLDNSGSMQSIIDGVKIGISKFAADLITKKVDARFSLVTFGDRPIIRMPFTTSLDELKAQLNLVQADGGAQEASFEAMRMALTAGGRDMTSACDKNLYQPAQCRLDWRSTATKVFIHATDEDSDLPIIGSYRTYQEAQDANCYALYQQSRSGNFQCANGESYAFEPSFVEADQFKAAKFYLNKSQYTYLFQKGRNGQTLTLAKSFQDEIDQTAALMIQQGVYLNSLVSYDIGTDAYYGAGNVPYQPLSIYNQNSAYWQQLNTAAGGNLGTDANTVAFSQFGNPSSASQSADFQSFNRGATISRLAAAGAGQSLQSQILKANGFARVFDVASFAAQDANMISAFYNAVVKVTSEINQQCVNIPDNTSTYSAGNTSTYSAGNTSTYLAGNTSTYSAGNTSTYSPGNTSTYSPGNTSTYSPGNTSTYSAGNTSTYSAGNTSTYSPGNTSTYSPGNTSTYSKGNTSTYSPGNTSTYINPGFVYVPNTSTYSVGNTSTYSPGNTSTYSPGNTSTYSPGNTSTYSAGNTSTYSAGNTSTYSPGNTSTYSAGNTSTYSPGNTSTYSAGNTSTYLAGNTSTYSPGNTSTYSAGNTSTYSPLPAPTQAAAYFFDFSSVTAYSEEENGNEVSIDLSHQNNAVVVLTPVAEVPRQKLSFNNKQANAQVEVISIQKTSVSGTEANIVKVSAPASSGVTEQTQSAPVSSTNAATISVLAVAASGAAAFGLIMLRRSKQVAKDLKFAFDQPESVAGENPLYVATTQTRENPLFVNKLD